MYHLQHAVSIYLHHSSSIYKAYKIMYGSILLFLLGQVPSNLDVFISPSRFTCLFGRSYSVKGHGLDGSAR